MCYPDLPFPNGLEPALLADIIDAASEAFLVVDHRHRIVYANHGASRVFGWSIEDLPGRPLDILLPDDTRLRHNDYMNDFAAGGPHARLMNERGEVRGRRHDGTEFPAEISIITRGSGEHTIFAAIVRDVTERHERETALRRSRQRLKQSQRIATMGSWDLDLRSNELYWSEEVYRIFGIEPEDFGASYEAFLERVHPDDRRMVETAVIDALERNAGYDIDHRIVRPDGEVRHVHEQAVTTHDADGIPVSMDGVVQDITDRKQVEHALTKARNEAVAANAAKSRFLATMSHELRTPLNAIIGFSQLLADETMGPLGSEAYREYAAGIRQSGGQLLEVIDAVLDAARIDSDQVDLEEEYLSVAALVSDTVRLVDLGRRDDVSRITVDAGDAGLQLFADGRLCRQILLNVCRNALKFSDPQSTVTVSVWRKNNDGDLVIQVSDRGPGMTSAELERVTEPFVQGGKSMLVHDGAATMYSHSGGVGLGLHLARTFAEAHGGRLELESMPGEGTCARVVMPSWRVVS